MVGSVENGRLRLLRGTATDITYDGPPVDAPTLAGPVVAMPLDGQTGTLHLRPRRGLSEREQHMLGAFAVALAATIRIATSSTQTARLAAQREHDASHDALTALPNRRHLERQLAAAMNDPDTRLASAVVLVDLNRFKEVNDSLGHPAGDRVLIEVTARLNAAAGHHLTARLGGDEYALLITGLATRALARHRAEQILATLHTPMDLDGRLIPLDASAGLAISGDCTIPQELLRQADVALYVAKGSSCLSVYTADQDPADLGRSPWPGRSQQRWPTTSTSPTSPSPTWPPAEHKRPKRSPAGAIPNSATYRPTNSSPRSTAPDGSPNSSKPSWTGPSPTPRVGPPNSTCPSPSVSARAACSTRTSPTPS